MTDKKSPAHLSSLIGETVDAEDSSVEPDPEVFLTLLRDPEFPKLVEKVSATAFVKGMSSVIDVIMDTHRSESAMIAKSDIACAILEVHACNADAGPLVTAWTNDHRKLKRKEDKIKADEAKADRERREADDLADEKHAAGATAANLKAEKRQRATGEQQTKIVLLRRSFPASSWR